MGPSGEMAGDPSRRDALRTGSGAAGGPFVVPEPSPETTSCRGPLRARFLCEALTQEALAVDRPEHSERRTGHVHEAGGMLGLHLPTDVSEL